ncbi:MAG: hypothetical protein JW729_00155, partial [Bacteroidales bacterium]|nr:hypothetical protein [Bacteroidales bacterium]
KEGMAHFLPSWYKFYCVLARSRYKFDRSQKTVMVQDFICGQVRVSRCMNHYKFVLHAGAIKNRDELMNYTVRVSGWHFYKLC